MEIVALDKRTRVAGLWLLPGSQLEFQTIGQANSFTYRNGGKIVDSKPTDKPDPQKTDRPKPKASKPKSSEADVPFVTERHDA